MLTQRKINNRDNQRRNLKLTIETTNDTNQIQFSTTTTDQARH